MRSTSCRPQPTETAIPGQPGIGNAASALGRTARPRCAAALALLLAAAGTAWSQAAAPQDSPDLTSLSLDELLDAEVVYSASKRVQSLREAPSAVTVVTAAEIREHGYRTLADVLRSLPSFYVTDDRNYSYVGVRGFDRPGDYSTRVLLLVNGVRTNDNVYEQAFVGEEFSVDLDLVSRIEVVRGPSAALYGNSAFFAVINVITKHGRDLQGGELAASGASFGSLGGRASYGRRLDSGLEILVSASVSDSRGQRLYFPEFDAPGTSNGVADRLDGERSERALLLVAKGRFALEASHVSRDKGIPTASFGTVFGDPRTRTSDVKDLVSLTYQQSGPDASAVLARAYYGHSDYHGTYLTAEPAAHLNDDWAQGQWYGLEASTVRPLGRGHLVTLGAEFHDDFSQRQRNFDVDPRVVYQDSHDDSQRVAVFAQDEIRLSGSLTLHLGLRHDWSKAFAGQTSPRLGFVYEGKATTLKLLHGRAFRAPNDFELHPSEDSYRLNPLLRPETIRTTELVVERDLRAGLRLNASAYFNAIDGLISLEPDPGGGDRPRFENAGRTDSLGIEAGLELRRSHGPSGRLSYALQRSRERGSREPLTNSPRHLAKAAMRWPFLGERLTAAVDARYMSARRSLAGAQADPSLVTDLTLLARRIHGSLDLSLSLYNVFGTRYADPGSEEHLQDLIPQDGRSFRAKLCWRF